MLQFNGNKETPESYGSGGILFNGGKIMLIGIIGAMDVEINGLKAVMNDLISETVSSVEYCRGKIYGTECIAAVAGVGKVNAAICAQTMILKYAPDMIINIGVAGGLSPELGTGDIAVADSVVEHDMDTTPLGEPAGYIGGLDRVYIDCDKTMADRLFKAASEIDGLIVRRGVIASGDQFIASSEQRSRIIDNFGAIAAEMEGASIGHVCAMSGVPFGVIRAISDGANGESPMSFPAFADMAAKNSINIILKLLED